MQVFTELRVQVQNIGYQLPWYYVPFQDSASSSSDLAYSEYQQGGGGLHAVPPSWQPQNSLFPLLLRGDCYSFPLLPPLQFL